MDETIKSLEKQIVELKELVDYHKSARLVTAQFAMDEMAKEIESLKKKLKIYESPKNFSKT